MTQQVQLTAAVFGSQLGQRLDQTLAGMFPDYSCSRVKKWIPGQRVLTDSKVCDKPKGKMLGGEQVAINAEIEEGTRFESQDIPLDIVHEDESVIVANKPRDLAVHPGADNLDNTVLNALLHYYPPTAGVPRTGIAHRLNRDIADLMVVARTVPAQARLVESLQWHEVTREYEAVTIGHMTAGGTVGEPISRHPTKHIYMAMHPMGRPVITHYRTMEHLRMHTRLRLRLETGHTRQIRVHVAHITRPLVGDPVYDDRPHSPKGASEVFVSMLRKLDRQALRATMLRLYHPISGVEIEQHALIPQDMMELIEVMRADFEEHKDEVDWL